LQVDVRDNNVDQALRVREKADAIRCSRKLARKHAQREGLLPASKKKVARSG
jgi:small subunit ribosomal protein S21